MLTAIIGGSGLAELEGLTITHREVMRTEYGEPSGPLTFGKMSGRDIVFFNRHGPGHTIPPHRVNYRANVFAVKQAAEAIRRSENATQTKGGSTSGLPRYANILPGNEASGNSVASVSNWQVKSHLPIGFVGRTVNGPLKK